jgi:hypothetical protein
VLVDLIYPSPHDEGQHAFCLLPFCLLPFVTAGGK